MAVATFQATDPIATTPLEFRLLIDPPTRSTVQSVNEEMIVGSNDVIVDVIGKAVTKIRGRIRIDGFQALKTFEGVVGSSGILVYSEEPTGIEVLWVVLERIGPIVPGDIHICSVEFWITPST